MKTENITYPNDTTRELTKLEYFAAKAMQGMLANSELPQSTKMITNWAIEHAEALINALNQTK